MSFQTTSGNGYDHRRAVLLVDVHTAKRLLRTAILTRLGMQASSAGTEEGLRLSHRHAYNLVLVGLQHDPAAALALGAQIRAGRPGQRVAYLVGKPVFLADAPDFEGERAGTAPAAPAATDEFYEQLLARACQSSRQRTGILEAAWQIASLRSLRDPRPPAQRASPLPERRRELSFGEAVRVAEIREGAVV
jgi:hypothetical protein